MKHVLSPLIILCFTVSGSYSQIMNGGFENWTAGNPDFWEITVEASQGTSSHMGNYCVSCSTGTLNNQSNGKRLGGSRIPFGSFQLSFWYNAKYDHQDWHGVATVGVSKNGVAGYWSALPLYSTTSWTKMTFSSSNYISHSDSTSADSIALTFEGLLSGYLFIDDVSLEPLPSGIIPSAISSPISVATSPNPISTHANLLYQIPTPASIHASLIDLTGRTVLMLPSLSSASGVGTIPFDCVGLPDGLYYLRFDVGGTVMMRKIIVRH